MGAPNRARRALLDAARGAASMALFASATGTSAKEVASAPRSAMGMATGDVPVSGVADQNLGVFDTLLSRFVAAEQVPGAQLAVSHQGRLVYARGFGWADRQQQQVVEPTALFRIASISKPITSVAVLQLVERGKLTLDAGVWALLGLAEPADPRWKRITVLHLLQHSGGWDREQGFDPMFQPGPFRAPRQIVAQMLARPLEFDPGSRQAYSNFGYCLLGRVIEHVTGTSYESHVQQAVLLPLGIHRMRLGKTARAQRAPTEVAYHVERDRAGDSVAGTTRKGTPLPYGAWSLEAMDAHGGWLASAVDLVRFACAFDDPVTCKILAARSIATLFARPTLTAAPAAAPNAPYYACGWYVRASGRPGQINAWHTGSLDGTSTLLVRRHDSKNWAVLFNARTAPDGKRFSDKVDPLLHQAVDAVRRWPTGDRFTELL